ncbi:hypothetical protein P1P68_40075, partial [Streptomyces scabiei]|nr:hypothetical protein [Streptomyces scabiei]
MTPRRTPTRLRAIVPPARHRWARRHPAATPGTGYLADDATPPATLRLQLNALQSLSRQTFAVRLVTLTIGTPFAMANTTDGPQNHAVLLAAVLGITVSYAMLRDWDRFAPPPPALSLKPFEPSTHNTKRKSVG